MGGAIISFYPSTLLTVEVTNFGCTLLKIVTKDKNNQDCDCILGFENVSDYQKRDGTYLNALVGRVCNRIEKGTFTINGTEYHVPINNGLTHYMEVLKDFLIKYLIIL